MVRVMTLEKMRRREREWICDQEIYRRPSETVNVICPCVTDNSSSRARGVLKHATNPRTKGCEQ